MGAKGPRPRRAGHPFRGYANLAELDAAVISCRRCPRLVAHREAIARTGKPEFRGWTYWGRPVPGFGDPDARLVLVGLAPAAHGANRTGRMFTGDSSGDWLYAALHRHGFANQATATGRDDGLVLEDCYVTASARCAPPGNKPTRDELDTCQPFLESELTLLRHVTVTIALGHIGLDRWLRASGWWTRLAPRDRPRLTHGVTTCLPDGMRLITSYHPSRQNTNTGRLTREMWDAVFATARRLLER